jgi:phospholipid/cholesterol/gamma-HCH transport system substrate-binding protein
VKLSKEFKIGVVVVCAIAAFIWGLNYLKGSNLFAKKHYLYAVYPKIEGLIPANPVLLKGYKIGQVSQISLIKIRDTNQVLVKFQITENVEIPIKSKARAISADLLGQKAVDIIFSDNKELVKNGDTLIAESEEGFRESIDRRIAPIQAKAEDLIRTMDSVIVVVSSILSTKNRENLDKSFEGIKRAILVIEQTAYKMDDLVGTEKVKISTILSHLNGITANLDHNNEKITKIIDNMASVSDSLAKSQLKEAIDDADKAMKELNTLVAGINQGQGTLGKLAKNDSLYISLNKSSMDLDKLLKDLRINPERYIHFSVFGRKERKKNKPKD